MGADPGLGDHGRRGGGGFASGGVLDAAPPGPGLARFADDAWRDGLGGLDDDELTGVMRAWRRLASRAAAGELAVVSELAARRAAGGRHASDHLDDEVGLALTLTRRAAGSLLDLALDLDRLRLTRAALAAGRIDQHKAMVIASGLAGLDDRHAAAVETVIITDAPGQTTGQLRAAVRWAVLAAGPRAARKRKEEALKDARVELWHDPEGTATLAGRSLPPAPALAADRALTAAARHLRAAGAGGTLTQLRARLFLTRLSGQPDTTLLPPVPGSAASQPAPSTDPGQPGPGQPGSGQPGSAAAGHGSARGPDPSPRPGSAAGTGADPPLPALAGSVNLTMPLSAWLGLSQSPGTVTGHGPLDVSDSRAIADALAARPGNTWCLTLTDPQGRPIAHGCARTGPPPRPPGTRPPGTRPPGAGPPGAGPPGTGPPGTGSPGKGPPSGTGPPSRADPPAGAGAWLSRIKITPMDTEDCSHRHQTAGYAPSRALRHLIEIRHAHCGLPTCRHPASRCDVDHTVPYADGGRTCACNTNPLCRKNHKTKQAPGWTLQQTRPGFLTWTAPSGRSYTSGPTTYRE